MSEKKLPHDKVVRITEVALAAVSRHADAHEVTRYEAADTLILAGAAAEEALADADGVPGAPAGGLVLSEEALAVVASWAAQAHHNDHGAAASDLVQRAWRRLGSLRAWEPKAKAARAAAREARLAASRAEMGEIADAVVATVPKAPASSSASKPSAEFYVPTDGVDLAEFKRIGRMRRADAPSDLAWGQVVEIARVVKRASGPVAIYCEYAERRTIANAQLTAERQRWGTQFADSARLLRTNTWSETRSLPEGPGESLMAWVDSQIELAGQVESPVERSHLLSGIRAEMRKRAAAVRGAQ